jgi:hypothetical protein
MNERILTLETETDSSLGLLKIWNLPFQSVLSNLLYLIDVLDDPEKNDNPFDFASRLSYILPELKKRCSDLTLYESFEAITLVDSKEYLQDLNFLNAYAHFSMIIPQVRRGTIVTTSIDNDKIKLEFDSDLTQKAELIDRLYSNLACELVIPYKELNKLEQFIEYEYKNDLVHGEIEYLWVVKLHEYYTRAQISIKVLPDHVLVNNFGFSHEELYSFCAAFRAFADFILSQGRVYKKLANDESLSEQAREDLAKTYMNCMVYQLEETDLELILEVSKIDEDKFYKIISYYTTVISNATNKEISNVSSCGDGYFPPLTLVSKVFITSPHAIRCLMTANNLLYSLNRTKKKIFDDNVSNELEPVLIKQIQRIFAGIPKSKSIPNIKYGNGAGEIDLMVLSEEEGICISIQAKATLAPDSSRTVARVEDRVHEGIGQTKRFDMLSAKEKLAIVNDAFNTKLAEVTIIPLVVVRSSAGSTKSWNYNDEYKIVNYPVLAKIIADKILTNNLSLKFFSNEIFSFQNEIISSSKHSYKTETLEINKTSIQFPIIEFSIEELMLTNFQTLKVFTEFLND